MLVLEESCSKTCVTVLCLRAILGHWGVVFLSAIAPVQRQKQVWAPLLVYLCPTHYLGDVSSVFKECSSHMMFNLPRPFFKHAPFLCKKLRTCWCRMNLIASEQLFLRKYIFFKCTFGDSSVRFAASGTQDDLEEMTGTSVTKVVTVVEACKVPSLKVWMEFGLGLCRRCFWICIGVMSRQGHGDMQVILWHVWVLS